MPDSSSTILAEAQPSLGMPDSAVRQWPAMLFAMAVFAVLSLTAAHYSTRFLEADACTHYLYSRFCLQEPHLLTNVWGRPFCTAIYALPAVLGGRMGVRVASMFIALAIALITWRIARKQGFRWPGLALIFVLGQPLLFLHSFSELTELPFALLMALALWAYQEKQWLAMALIVSIMPTTRPEGFGLLVVAAFALLCHRRWRWIPLLAVPLVLWSYIGWVQFGRKPDVPWWRWLPTQWPYAADSLYERGLIVHFILRLPAIVSPLAFPAVLLGIWRSFAFRRDERLLFSGARDAVFGPDHRLRVQWIIALIPLTVLTGHSLLYWAGKMASNGELRYMLVAAPMWGLLAAAGWEWAFIHLNWRSALGWAGLAVLVPAMVNGVWKVVPLGTTPEWARGQEAAVWYETTPYNTQRTRLIATCRDVYYFLDLSPSNWKKSAEYWRPTIEKDHTGIVLIWDPIYGVYNSDSNRSIKVDEILKNGWIPVQVFSDHPMHGRESTVVKLAEKIQSSQIHDWLVFLSPLDEDGKPRTGIAPVPIPPDLLK